MSVMGEIVDAGAVQVDDELGQPGVGRGVGVGAGDEVAPVGVGGPAGPDLGAVDDPVVAVAHGRVRIDATSLPASGSLMPIDQADVPATMSGRKRRRCSGVPNCRRVGPIWRSANHDVATGAPAAISASNTTNRSSGAAAVAALLDRPGHAQPAPLGQLERELARGADEPRVLPARRGRRPPSARPRGASACSASSSAGQVEVHQVPRPESGVKLGLALVGPAPERLPREDARWRGRRSTRCPGPRRRAARRRGRRAAAGCDGFGPRVAALVAVAAAPGAGAVQPQLRAGRRCG